MSDQIVNRPDAGYVIVRYNGGDILGPCVQVTGEHGYIQLTRTGARTLAHDLIHRFLKSIPTVGDATAAMVDDAGVEDLALAMKEKLSQKRNEGHDGWYDLEKCPPERLALLLLDHLPKGDPVDLANFAMFIYHRQDAKDIITEIFPVWLNQQENQKLEESRAETANARLERNLARDQVSNLEQEVSRLKGECNEARRILEKETERMRKERDQLAARLAQAEQNLSRSLGYIDRVTEGEPPLPTVRQETHYSVGDVGESYVTGSEPRGPKLDLGEPCREEPRDLFQRYR